MKKIDNDLGLKRFREINKYADKLVIEQEMPSPPAAPPMPPTEPAADATTFPPEGTPEMPPLSGDTETPETPENPEVDAETASADDTTEELDVTDLVNMTKSIKKQLDDQPKSDVGVTQKMDDVFTKLNDLEQKLGEMDNILAKIDQLGVEIEKSKPKTPVEKLEMRSLDSYPFSKNPTEFFNEKQQEMKASGKNEYVLTKNDVENYGKYEIMKSFNPKAMENDYNF